MRQDKTAQMIGQPLQRASDDLSPSLVKSYRIVALLGKQPGRRTFLAIATETGLKVVVKLLLFGPDFTWEDLTSFPLC